MINFPSCTMSLSVFTSLLLLTCDFLMLVEGECDNHVNVWEEVGCKEEYFPPNCNMEEIARITVEDFDRCGPALLSIKTRNIFLGAAGRRITYNENQNAFKRIWIIPKMLRNVAHRTLETTVLGKKVSFPVGHSPVPHQKLVHPMGEVVTAKGVSDLGTIMILSSLGMSLLEDVAANNEHGHLWMQLYIFQNRSWSIDLVQRAEENGYEAIVMTVDSPFLAPLSCNADKGLSDNYRPVNIPFKGKRMPISPAVTFDDITWVKSLTQLPIVAKGILSVRDAMDAIDAGASAILVSNHGGRQMDGAPATIDVLPSIADAVKEYCPHCEVYLDSGVRNGYDVYKAIARGARFVFAGRPVIWGLAEKGKEGVKQVLNILKSEFNETMILAGASCPSEITRDTTWPLPCPCTELPDGTYTGFSPGCV